MILTVIKKQMELYVEAKELICSLNKQPGGKGKYEIYQEQIRKTRQQITHFIERKAALYQDYADGLISEEDYVAIGQDYGKKSDDLNIYLGELDKEAKKYSADYQGSEKWEQLLEEYRNQEQLTRDMVERFVEKIVVFNDGRVEILLNHRDELEVIFYEAAVRRREGVKRAV